MAYSSYNEYIVLNNCCLILGLSVLNYIVFTFNLKPLSYILASNVIQALECILSFLCFFNILRVSKVFVLPYFVKVKASFPPYLFASGPATSALKNLLRYFITDVALGRDPSKTEKPSTSTTDENPESRQLFLNFNNEPNALKVNTDGFYHAIIIGPENMTFTTPDMLKEAKRALAYEQFLTKNSKLAAYANPNDPTISNKTELRSIPCIKPPLVPSEYRPRTLWFLHPTPEVVEDFKIEQILAFRKYWNKFSTLVSDNYYDKMTEELYEKIFKPLANSIAYFTTLLATKNKTIANCPPATIGISLLLPRFNNNSDFSFFEVVNFISLGTYSDDVEKQYIFDRILDLGRSKKLAGYRCTPKSAGMPTDSQIIMHVLKFYLLLKEPFAIPPLVPADATDFFKFLLIYFYITPELNHWKIFN